MKRILLLLLTALSLADPSNATAHDKPSNVTIQMFVKPVGRDLHMIIRVPLQAMHEFEFPEREGGYLDLAKVNPMLRDAAIQELSHAMEVYEENGRLPKPQLVETRISLESDTSFDSYNDALAHLKGARLPTDTNVNWDQTMLDVLFDYPIQSDHSRFSIHPGLEELGMHVIIVLRFLPPNSTIRAFEFLEDPGLVRLDPRWNQVALRFVSLGFVHILAGTDHLLFLFCLVVPFRQLRALIPIVTAFTVSHSITLIASAWSLEPGVLWFAPLITTLIASSIIYLALEDIVGSITVERRWLIAFGFGLVHGFGLSFILKETLQLAGSHMSVSLLSFNIGVELAQIIVLALLIPILQFLFRFWVAERTGTVFMSAIIARATWPEMVDRAEILRRFQFQSTNFDAALMVNLLHWLMFLVSLAGIGWLTLVVFRHHFAASSKHEPTQVNEDSHLQ